jgi:SAM-dependent methyltransferase
MERWRASSEALYREVVHATEVGPGQELIVAGCGTGAMAEWIAFRTGVAVTGVDSDPGVISAAESRARNSPSGRMVAYETAKLDDLPHETGVFDAAVAEPAMAAAADPARAVAELVRVTKPMGVVVLLQPTWSSLSVEAREPAVERLGLRPFLLIEWKQMLRDAGVVDIQVQDWSDGGARRRSSLAPVGGPELTWQHKAHIVSRAWRRWGWRAARGAVERERQLLCELARERALGFQLIRGVKWPHPLT